MCGGGFVRGVGEFYRACGGRSAARAAEFSID